MQRRLLLRALRDVILLQTRAVENNMVEEKAAHDSGIEIGTEGDHLHQQLLAVGRAKVAAKELEALVVHPCLVVQQHLQNSFVSLSQ